MSSAVSGPLNMRTTKGDALASIQALNRNPSDDFALFSCAASLGGLHAPPRCRDCAAPPESDDVTSNTFARGSARQQLDGEARDRQGQQRRERDWPCKDPARGQQYGSEEARRNDPSPRRAIRQPSARCPRRLWRSGADCRRRMSLRWLTSTRWFRVRRPAVRSHGSRASRSHCLWLSNARQSCA